MDIADKIDDFNKRWVIEDDLDYSQRFKKFKNAIISTLKSLFPILTVEDLKDIWNYIGISPENNKGLLYLLEYFNDEINEKKFFLYLDLFLSIDKLKYYGIQQFRQPAKNYIYREIEQLIKMHRINLAITKDSSDEIILYPQSEIKLDKELIDPVFSFLNDKSNEPFKDALKFYQEGNSVQSAERVRRSLEEWLRYKLKNVKGLAENIKELLKLFKTLEVSTEIKNIIRQNFDYLDKYFNEHSKHQDGQIGSHENEYLIYQAAVLMRYINNIIS